MPIYKQHGNKLTLVKERRINLEKTVQTLVESNLEEVFSLKLITTEFPLNNLRIDTLAFDEELNTFVIIEYKREKSFSVVDQGYAYLAMLLNNKADFVLEYNEKCKKNLRKNDVDWSQSRVVFVSQSFTKYQQEAMGFRDLPIELWEVRHYENDLILINEIVPSEKSESIKTVAKGKNVEVVNKEIVQFSVSDHLKPEWTLTTQLYDSLSQRILELDSRFEVRPVNNYIGFNIGGKNVVAVRTRSNKLVLDMARVQPSDLRDPEKRTTYVVNSYEHWHKHMSRCDITSEEDVDYAMMLIKQVYKRFIE